MRALIFMAIPLSLCACAAEPPHEARQQPAVTQDEESPAPPDAEAADTGADSDSKEEFCQEISMRRVACGDSEAECEDKSLTERTCAAGCSSAELCVAEIASGDLYRLSCSWLLEDAEGRLRGCTDEEEERWWSAQRGQ